MLPTLHLPVFAASLLVLSACQMDTTQSVENFEAERIARTMGLVESCRVSECGRLNLDSGDLEDYGIVADMAHVTAFMTSYTDFDDLSDIAAMSQLRELHIGSTQVRDLNGLSNFPSLTLLHAQELRNVNDYSAVGRLTGLTELALGRSDLGDLSVLRGLTRLKSVNLMGATMTSLNGLRNHPTLESIDLISADLPEDISVLKTIPNLRELSVTDWNLSEAQRAVIDELSASGVNVIYEVAMIVC